MRSVLIALATLILLAGCEAEPKSQATPSEIGRFRIVEAGGRIFMLDTDAGRAWELGEGVSGPAWHLIKGE